jgi:uncharacterized protein YodC (DUF2158 family)
MEGSMVLGVLEPTPEGPRLAWLEKPQPVTPELLSLTGETECRWYQQEGKAACFRCPEIVTHLDNPSAEMLQAAQPH